MQAIYKAGELLASGRSGAGAAVRFSFTCTLTAKLAGATSRRTAVLPASLQFLFLINNIIKADEREPLD